VDVPATRYARSGDVSIAYQVTGDGPFDLVYVPGFISNVELAWQMPLQAEFFNRLASFCRLIRFDKRGTGMSDRISGAPTLETRMDDVRAVMDAAGSSRAALLGLSEGGPMSVLFAATYPERSWAMVLWGAFPRILWAPDYPVGMTESQYRHEAEEDQRAWLDPDRMVEWVAPVVPGADDENIRALAAGMRQSASPGAVEALNRMNAEIDVREVLPAIEVPTLVMVRSEDDPMIVGGSRYLGEHIVDARYVELPGSAHAPFAGDAEPVLERLERFLNETWQVAGTGDREPDRVLATVLFTDIVGSTAKAVELGDRGWRELVSEHNARVRRTLGRFQGREIDTAGDGFFASGFDGPARAIRCAAEIVQSVRDLGVDIRAGLHTGECELIDDKLGGIAVNIGARVASQAAPGEVLVSRTVKDLVAGSGIEFEDRGAFELKGIPGNWELFAVRG
jgi:pimeloyl-ACP methyl ester carboxylesterase